MKLRIVVLLFALVGLAACAAPAPAATDFPTHTPVETRSPSATATGTETVVIVPTVTPAPTLTPVPTITPSSTVTPTPTITPTPTLIAGTAPPLEPLPVTFITNGDRDLPYVALTFDVGQTPQNPAWFDQAIYDVLVEYQAPATFFLGGDWIRTHIEETRLLASNPLFELGNHSWSHPDLRTLPQPEISAEILRTQDILYQVTGEQTLLFRLPSGFYNDLVLGVIAWHGLYTIQWDVVTGDPDPNITAEDMLEKAVKPRTQNGSIIIMHANGRGWNTAEALPGMIEYLRGAGYTLVTVSQLIGLEALP